MIHQQHADAVFDRIASVIHDMGAAADYRRLFDLALATVRTTAESASLFPPVDLPMAVADAMGRPLQEAVVAAAACTLLWSGADLMDDAADGQLVEAWQGVSPHQIALVATNLLSTLPHLLVGRFDGGDGSVSSAWSQAVSRTLFTMSEGQWSDLQSSRTVETVDDYLALVRRKTGAEFALFASAPAILADADGETIGAWVRFGFAYGTMSQVFSDTVSTVAPGPRNDLLSGKRTLPVLHTLAALRDEEHKAFVADLDSAAAGDQEAVERILEGILGAGALSKALQEAELFRYRAFRAVPEGAEGQELRILLHVHELT
jgi:geranylgeranyl pyrophosphate synthase